MTLGAHTIMAIELSQTDLNKLESAAGAFGAGYQNLGRSADYFSMTSYTLGVTFKPADLASGYQVLLNNFGQYSISLRNDDLIIQLNTENGQDRTLTFRDAITDNGWQDVHVIVNDETGTLDILLNGETLHSGSSEGLVVENASFWDVTAGGTPWGAAFNGQIADVTVLDYPVSVDPEDSLVARMENLDSDGYVWDENNNNEPTTPPDEVVDETPVEQPEEETPEEVVDETPVEQPEEEAPSTNVGQSDEEILQSAAADFGSGYQNLGRSADYFSMSNMTLNTVFNVTEISNDRQVLLNNFGQYALLVRGSTLTVELNKEGGQDLRLTFDNLITETGWQDIQVIVSNDEIQVWHNGNEVYTGPNEGVVIDEAAFWDVTAGGTPWGSTFNGEIAAVTVIDKAVTIDPNSTIVERMFYIDGQADGTGSSGRPATGGDQVVDTPDDVTIPNIPNVPDEPDDADNSEAVVTGTSNGEVTEDVDLTTSGKLNAADADAGESGFQEDTENGDYGSFTISEDGNWTYTLTDSDDLDWLDTGEVVTETFTVRTIDGTTSEVTVDINGRNEPTTPNTGGGTGGNTGGGSTPTLGVIEVSSTAGLIQALSGNVAGYTIELAPGDYGTINLNNYNFSSPVVITSASPNNPAHFESISVRNSSNIEFNSLDVVSNDAPSGSWGEYLITIDNSSDIVISDSFVSTSRSTGMAEGFTGLIVKNSNGITVEDSEFTNMSGGAGFISSNNINIFNNEFHDIRVDGVTFSGVQGVEIDGNYFHDFYHTTGDHSDYVQFWVTAGLQSNVDIVITNNLMTQGNGYDTQGIFMTATSGQPMQNVVIENNVIYQSGYHGISVTNANGVEINDNTVISPPDSATGFEVWIAMTGVTNGVLENNISNSFVLNGSSVSQSGNLVAYDSSVPWNAGSYPTSSYDQVFVNDMNINSVHADDFALSAGINAGADISNLLGDILGGTLSAFSTTVASIDDNEPTVGDDYIEGTSANDLLFGFDGDDELFGFGGSDILVGGDGADTLSGGAGRDTFVYTEIGDSGIGNGNRDVIMDFDATNGDMLSFEGFATDDFAFSFNDNTDVLSIDLDGDFTIDMEIQLIGVSASDLDGSDFMT